MEFLENKLFYPILFNTNNIFVISFSKKNEKNAHVTSTASFGPIEPSAIEIRRMDSIAYLT